MSNQNAVIVLIEIQHGASLFRNIAVRGTVEIVASNLILLLVLIRNGVGVSRRGERLVKGGIEHRNLRQ